MEEAAVATPTAPRTTATIEYPQVIVNGTEYLVTPAALLDVATARALLRRPLDGPGPGRGELAELAY